MFWNYSNPHFYIAGRALEVATDTPYREAIRERVLEPLGMRRSFFLGSEVVADGDFTNGYGVLDASGEGPLVDIAPDAYDNAWARPAGYGFSSVLDWARLLEYLASANDPILTHDARREVLSAQVSTHTIYSDLASTGLGLADDYGLGVAVGSGFFMDRHEDAAEYYDIPFVSHGGDISGFAATFAAFPSTGFGIVVLSNRDIERPIESMRLALETFGGLPAPSAPPPGREPDPARFARYAGDYQGPTGETLLVRATADALEISGPLLDGTGLPYAPVLEPTSLDNFALWVTYAGERLPLEVTFFPDASGEFTWLRSRAAVARKVASGTTPVEAE